MASLVALGMALIYRARHTHSESVKIHIIDDMDFQPKFRAQQVSTFYADKAEEGLDKLVNLKCAGDDPVKVVYHPEFISPTSPLWGMEQVIISPHVGGYTQHYYERVFELFRRVAVDAAVVEVGMGGSWDATNVADGAVARLGTPSPLGGFLDIVADFTDVNQVKQRIAEYVAGSESAFADMMNAQANQTRATAALNKPGKKSIVKVKQYDENGIVTGETPMLFDEDNPALTPMAPIFSSPSQQPVRPAARAAARP